MSTRRSSFAFFPVGAMALAITACSSSTPPTVAPTPTATPSPTIAAAATATGTVAPTVAPTATPTATTVPTMTAAPTPTSAPTPPQPTGPASVGGPDEVAANTVFDVAWTGPNAQGDYVAIVPAGAVAWTSADDYFYTTLGSPGELLSPTTAGEYDLGYVSGASAVIVARQPITVTSFVGALTAPDEVVAGTDLQVSWFGPNAPSDYITIVPVGTTTWSGQDYWSTSAGDPALLTADVVAGAYEIWYAAGQDQKAMLRRPITVTPFVVTLEAPDRVTPGSDFGVDWTGPDGPSDYITIVPVGSEPSLYGDYAYTRDGTPLTLTAPTIAGDYEIRYASDRVDIVFASIDIEVRP